MAANFRLIARFGGWGEFQRLLHALRAVADRLSSLQPQGEVTLGMVAIAWVLRQRGVCGLALGRRLPKTYRSDSTFWTVLRVVEEVSVFFFGTLDGVLESHADTRALSVGTFQKVRWRGLDTRQKRHREEGKLGKSIYCVQVLGARDATHVRAASIAATSLVLSCEDLARIESVTRAKGPLGEVFGVERATGSVHGPFACRSRRSTCALLPGGQLEECLRRLAALHSAYARVMPPTPAFLDQARARAAQGDVQSARQQPRWRRP